VVVVERRHVPPARPRQHALPLAPRRTTGQPPAQVIAAGPPQNQGPASERTATRMSRSSIASRPARSLVIGTAPTRRAAGLSACPPLAQRRADQGEPPFGAARGVFISAGGLVSALALSRTRTRTRRTRTRASTFVEGSEAVVGHHVPHTRLAIPDPLLQATGRDGLPICKLARESVAVRGTKHLPHPTRRVGTTACPPRPLCTSCYAITHGLVPHPLAVHLAMAVFPAVPAAPCCFHLQISPSFGQPRPTVSTASPGVRQDERAGLPCTSPQSVAPCP